MLFRNSLLLLCLISITAVAQQPDVTRIKNEDEFAPALLQASRSSATALLDSRKDLITARLWQRLIDDAPNYPGSMPATYGVALQVANELRDQRLIGLTYYKSARYYFNSGNISLTIENYQRSKQAFEGAGLKRDLIYVLADLGTLHIYSADYEKAKLYSEQSITLAEQLKDSKDPAGAYPDEYGVATALSNLGNISKRDGEFEKAIDCFKRSLGLYQKIDAGSLTYSLDILDDLADIGRAYRSLGDNVQSLVYLNRAMEMAKVSRVTERVAGIYNSLGILYSDQRDYSRAIEFFQQGLQLTADDRLKQAEMLLNIGVAYQFQGDYDRALQSFVKSQEIAKAIDYKEVLIPVEEGIGAVYKEQGKYKEAQDALEASLKLAKGIDDKTRIAEISWRKAEVQYAKGDYSASISNASEAVVMADQLNLQNVSYLALTTLGRAQRAQKQDNLAAQTFSKAIGRIEEMRDRVVGAEQESELFFEDKVGPYREMIDLLVNRHNPESDAQALLYAERAKGRVLLDVLRHGKVSLVEVMTQAERDEERRLNRNIVALNLQLKDENSKQVEDASLLKSLKEELRSARSQYETFQDSVYASHSDLKGKRQQSRAITLNSFDQVVQDNKTAFLEYVVTKDRTYLFVITKKPQGTGFDLRVYGIAIGDKALADKANEFRHMIADRDPTFAGNSRELYDLLVKPAEDQIKGKETVCIIPDASLWNVPFQALLGKAGQYLLQDYALYYAPSLDVLGEMSKRVAYSYTGSASLLAFGNPSLGSEAVANLKETYRGESLAPLPEAETEVKALREIWGADRSRILVGADAAKKAFKTEAAKYEIIHLATHGILDDSNPMYSRLAMAHVNRDPDDDGLLEAREIMQMNLHATLVVLSACQTARGRIGAGEGVVGISWAFFVAGVPTTVVSQWKVDSASTATLMISFHRHLKDQGGTAKAQALRQAALELLKEKAHQHPFYWAGFVMIGNGM